MFWSEFYESSELEELLRKPDTTLLKVLDEPDALHLCKAGNAALIDFLTMPEHFDQLVSFVCTDPEDLTDEFSRFRYASVSSELLTADASRINDKLLSDPQYFQRIYDYLTRAKPSDCCSVADDSNSSTSKLPIIPLMASFCYKVYKFFLGHKFSGQVLEFFMTKPDFVDMVLMNLENLAIVDLLLCSVWLFDVSGTMEVHDRFLQWLQEQHLVKRLVDLMHPNYSRERQLLAAKTCCDLVVRLRDLMTARERPHQSLPLLCEMQSEKTIEQVVDNIDAALKNSESAEPATDADARYSATLQAGLLYLQHITDFLKPVTPMMAMQMLVDGSETAEHMSMTKLEVDCQLDAINNTIVALTPRLAVFKRCFVQPPKQLQTSIKTSAGEVSPPLGLGRIALIRVMNELLVKNKAEFCAELESLKLLPAILDSLFQFVHNSFLHTQVYRFLSTLLQLDAAGEQASSESAASEPAERPDAAGSGESSPARSPHAAAAAAPSDSPPLSDAATIHPSPCAVPKPHPLFAQLFNECHLLERLIANLPDQQQSQRAGYCGHLILLARQIERIVRDDKHPQAQWLATILNEKPDEVRSNWKDFCENKLAAMIKCQESQLGGTDPRSRSDSGDIEPTSDRTDIVAMFTSTKAAFSSPISQDFADDVAMDSAFRGEYASTARPEHMDQLWEQINRVKEEEKETSPSGEIEWPEKELRCSSPICDLNPKAITRHNLNLSDEEMEGDEVRQDSSSDDDQWRGDTRVVRSRPEAADSRPDNMEHAPADGSSAAADDDWPPVSRTAAVVGMDVQSEGGAESGWARFDDAFQATDSAPSPDASSDQLPTE